MGGTMIDFATMAFFKDVSGQIRTKMLMEESETLENTLMHYDAIYTLKKKAKVYYIAQGFGQGSTALPWQELRAFEIKSNKLINPKIFPGKEENVFVEFDTHEFSDRQRIPTIKIRNGGKTVLVPMQTEREGFTGKYKTLVWQGQVYILKR